MKRIVFATNNKHKLEEISAILGDRFEIVSLAEINCFDDIPETANTLEGNALQKARFVKEKFGYDCFADDTGLEIEALNNAPGVYSARYAGPARSSEDNMNKALEELKDKANRKARFRTVIALILDGKEYLFDGIVNGSIATEKKGAEGFGYDPIFVPEGYCESFAQLGADVKNKISHRARATAQLADFLALQDF